jgi:hypothetical protein
MSHHANNGLSIVIFRLAFLATILIGVFHFFMILMFKTPSISVKKNSYSLINTMEPASTPEESAPASITDRMIQPTKQLVHYRPLFQPKELINEAEPHEDVHR